MARVLVTPLWIAWRLLKAHAISEDFDQTARLIRLVAGSTSLILGCRALADIKKLPRKCSNHEAKPSRGTKRMRDEEQKRTTLTPHIKPQIQKKKKERKKKELRQKYRLGIVVFFFFFVFFLLFFFWFFFFFFFCCCCFVLFFFHVRNHKTLLIIQNRIWSCRNKQNLNLYVFNKKKYTLTCDKTFTSISHVP